MNRKLLCVILLLALPAFPRHRKTVIAPRWVQEHATYTPVEGSEEPSTALLFKSTGVGYGSGRIILRKRVVYKILRTSALGVGTLIIQYSGKDKVTGIDGWRLNGKKVCLEKLEKKNIAKLALNENFVDDERQIIASFKTIDKGDIVAFQYTMTVESFFDDIFLPMGYNGEIDRLEATVSGTPRISVLNDLNHVVQKEGKTYVVENQPYLKPEYKNPHFADKIPYLAISYNAGITDWASFGLKYWKQASGRLDLSQEAKTETDKLFPQSDPLELIPAVCRFVSGHINYVDIELGKGGIIPHFCSEVLQHRYGDCKDMTFLAAGILRSRGVQAFPVMAQVGSSGKVFPEFPGNQFNHAILAVKLDEKTRKLANTTINKQPFLIADMTDRITQPPFLQAPLEGTNALLVTDKGGQIIQLPRSSAESNVYQYIISAHLYLDKSIIADLTEIKMGQPAYDELGFRDSISKQEEKEGYRNWIQRMIPGAVLSTFDVIEGEGIVKTTCKLTLQNAGIEATDGTYIIPDLVDMGSKNYFRRKRRFPVVFSDCHTRKIHVVMKLSEGLNVVKAPEGTELDTPYFHMSRHCNLTGKTFTMDIVSVWKKIRIPLDEYKAFRKAYRRYIRELKAPLLVR
ncbi:MAG: DUF3857 and transglutaminase domain-containing protein [Acidobacteria bacterium]|nr:DUF3857 and transglutaminase domain-containing protein [Acidobacteriota bacterium]